MRISEVESWKLVVTAHSDSGFNYLQIDESKQIDEDEILDLELIRLDLELQLTMRDSSNEAKSSLNMSNKLTFLKVCRRLKALRKYITHREMRSTRNWKLPDFIPSFTENSEQSFKTISESY